MSRFKSYDLTIQFHDFCLAAIFLLILLNRNFPIDYSSIWKIGILMMLYILAKLVFMQRKWMLSSLIVFWGGIESGVAILQKLGWCDSGHDVFEVMGNFDNPAPLGALLSIALVINFTMFRNEVVRRKCKWKLICIFSLMLILIGLFLSESRAGWIAAIVGLLYWLYSKVLKKHLLSLRRRMYGTLFLFLFLSLFLMMLYWLKTDSADGRLFIWMNTLQMIADNPFIGVGTGGWLSNYMHYQADYFLHNPDSKWIELADNVFYPYNEFLLFVAEHGLCGMVWLFGFLYSFFMSKKKMEYGVVEAKSVFLSLLTFACFSYPLNVFELQMLFIVWVGIMNSHPLIHFSLIGIKKTVVAMSLVVLILMVSVHSYSVYSKSYANIMELCNNGFEESRLDKLYPYFCFNSSLMFIYQQLSFDCCSSKKALLIAEATARLVPTSDVYCDMGEMLEMFRNYEGAEYSYCKANAMVPSRLTPQYNLFQLYLKQDRINEAIAVGEKILLRPLKKENIKELRIKGEVLHRLQKLKIKQFK